MTELSCLDPDLDLDSKYCNVICTSVQCTQLRLELILITLLHSRIDYWIKLLIIFIGRHPQTCQMRKLF
jgi:hypothetical protein